MKEVNPKIELGHGSFKYKTGWIDELLPITKDYVDWLSLYHDYSTNKE